MSKAFQYIRISEKDQSNYSLAAQNDGNRNYATKYGIDIVSTFVDNGESARTFNRKEWRNLEKEIYARRREIRYLIVWNYDRLVRNLVEGLIMLQRIEEKWGIKVLSATQDFGINPDNPYYFRMRADMLLRADDEWRMIRYRTKMGIWKGRKEGYYLNKAPFGYKNVKNESGKSMLIRVPEKAQIIAYIIDAWNAGIGESVIKQKAKQMGWRQSGHDRIKRVVGNMVYYGFVEVPAFGGEKAHRVKAKHEGVRTEDDMRRALARLNNRRPQPKIILTEHAPLRGVVRCLECHRKMTAGESKGKRRKYWYYRCLYCKRQNHNALRAHQWFEDILSQLSFPEKLFLRLVDMVENKFDQKKKMAQKDRALLRTEHLKIGKKLEAVEERYLNNKIEEGTYRRWYRKYEAEMLDLDHRLREMDNLLQVSHINLKAHAQLFTDLNYTWQKLDVDHKNQFATLVFNNELYLCKGGYRTPRLPLLLPHKNQKIKGLDIIEKGKSTEQFGEFPLRTRDGT
ncbi:MAG: recombinase family protein [Bacteroidota bacterium]